MPGELIVAMLSLQEKPAQQVQWQNGEQSSCCGSPFCWVDLTNSDFILSFAEAPLSAHGTMLNANTRKAIMNANNLIWQK